MMLFEKIMDSQAAMDWQEAFDYRSGVVVELKSQPGTYDTIAYYDSMMVPPVWLVNSPCPRYPHELRVVSSVTAAPTVPVAAAFAPVS